MLSLPSERFEQAMNFRATALHLKSKVMQPFHRKRGTGIEKVMESSWGMESSRTWPKKSDPDATLHKFLKHETLAFKCDDQPSKALYISITCWQLRFPLGFRYLVAVTSATALKGIPTSVLKQLSQGVVPVHWAPNRTQPRLKLQATVV